MAEIWTKEDSQTARSQGWDVFDAFRQSDVVQLIERCDEMDVFEDDLKAIEFVKQQAAEGSPLASKALHLDRGHRTLRGELISSTRAATANTSSLTESSHRTNRKHSMHTTKIKFGPLAAYLKQGGVVPSINDGNRPWFLKASV